MKRQFSRPTSTNGLSMIEVLAVVALLAVLFAIVMNYLGKGHLVKARDAQRKDDLHDIKIAFEEYYNDNSCYPPADTLLDCKGSALSPYLNEIPCDPLSTEPYIYIPYPSTDDTCSGFRVYSALEWEGDPVISQLGCEGGCGLLEAHLTFYGIQTSDISDYTYGVSEGVPVEYTEGNPGLTSGYCCEVPGDDCQNWIWSPQTQGCSGYGPYITLEECYAGAGGCGVN